MSDQPAPPLLSSCLKLITPPASTLRTAAESVMTSVGTVAASRDSHSGECEGKCNVQAHARVIGTILGPTARPGSARTGFLARASI
jgi:hypothetical protein